MATAESPNLTSIVVVAADSGPLLGACIDAALQSTAQVEVVLVDNASGDGEVERVAAAHATDPRLRVLRNEANIGFGPACNRGASQARGDALLFLNPDCELRHDTVRLAFAVLGPLLLMVVFGYGISLDVNHLTFATLDFDNTAASRSYSSPPIRKPPLAPATSRRCARASTTRP